MIGARRHERLLERSASAGFLILSVALLMLALFTVGGILSPMPIFLHDKMKAAGLIVLVVVAFCVPWLLLAMVYRLVIAWIKRTCY